MDANTLFVKTPKGVDEIENRTFGLPPRTRQVLIMADGKRDMATISEMVPVQDAKSVLVQLHKDGFLSIVPPQRGVKNIKPVESDEDDFIVPTDPQERLKLARNFMINTTQTFVGVFGSGLIKQAQTASSPEELLLLVDQWYEAIASAAGHKQSEDLKSRLKALL
jgi:hypothetical protein